MKAFAVACAAVTAVPSTAVVPVAVVRVAVVRVAMVPVAVVRAAVGFPRCRSERCAAAAERWIRPVDPPGPALGSVVAHALSPGQGGGLGDEGGLVRAGGTSSPRGARAALRVRSSRSGPVFSRDSDAEPAGATWNRPHTG